MAHYTGSGLDYVFDLNEYDYFSFLDEALKLYEIEVTTPRRVILSGIEKSNNGKR